jgi:hypothetical protein
VRVLLWEVIYSNVRRSWSGGGSGFLTRPWEKIFYDKHVYRDHQPADEFYNVAKNLVEGLKTVFLHGDYTQVLGFVQWLLRRPDTPYDMADRIEAALQESGAAYSVFDRDTIVPIGSDAERETLVCAFADVSASEFNGARAHLRNAGSELTAGSYG